jgi:hypothetical protein
MNSLYQPLQSMNFTYVRLCTTVLEQPKFHDVLRLWEKDFLKAWRVPVIYRTERIDNLIYYHIILPADLTVAEVFNSLNDMFVNAGVPEDKELFHRTIDVKKIL